MGEQAGQRRRGAYSVIYPRSHIPPGFSPIWPHSETSRVTPSSPQFSPTHSIKWIHKKREGGSGICMFPNHRPKCDSVQEALKPHFKNTVAHDVWLFLSTEDTAHIFGLKS